MTTSSKKTLKTLNDQPSIQGEYSNFGPWMAVLKEKTLSVEDQVLWLKGLHDHPEWLNKTNQYKKTPLIMAAKHGKVEAVKALIQNGSALNVQDQYGWTALMWAAHEGYVDIVQYFIQQGVNPLVLNNDHESALDLAKKVGEDVVGAILAGYVEAYSSRQTLNQALSSLDPDSRVVVSNDPASSLSKGLRL